MSEQEQWRPVVGFPDYMVSDLGQVRSRHAWRGRPGRTLVGFVNNSGYRILTLCASGQRSRQSVHRLVAASFLGPCPTGMEVRHLDGDKTHNAASNLAYGTKAQNNQDQVIHGVHANARKTHCKRGHAFTDDNTRLTADGKRVCRTCRLRNAARAAA